MMAAHGKGVEEAVFKRRVLVVEDQPLMRQSLVATLAAHGFDVESAADARAAIDAYEAFDPDGLLVDLDLGHGPNGLDVVFGLRARNPVVPAVILTRLSDPRLAGSALAEDPMTAFITKQRLFDPTRVVAAITSVIAGKGASFRDDIEGGRPSLALTGTQIEILEMVADGLSNEQIAAEREISSRAVQRTIIRALASLGIEPRADQDPRVLAVRAYLGAMGLLPHESARGNGLGDGLVTAAE